MVLVLELDGEYNDHQVTFDRFLDKVVITNMATNVQSFFLCGRWLDKSEDDGQIVREIPASNKDGVTFAPLSTYKIEVTTGNRRGAGTGNCKLIIS